MMIRPSDRILILLVVSIAVLLLLTVVFAAILFYLHVRNEKKGGEYGAMERAWEPLLLQALEAGTASMPGLVLRTQTERLHFVAYLVRYARRLRGAEKTVLDEMARPLLPEIAARVRHQSPEVRARAVQTLTTLGMPEYAQAVITALDDASPLVAMTAARGLARKEHAQYAGDVLARVHRFEGWNHHFLAAMLSSMGAAAVPTLRSLLANNRAPAESRGVAAQALGQLNDLGSASIAVDVLHESPPRELLADALGLLSIVGHEGHLPAVIPLLDSPESWVRAQALETLSRLGSRDQVPVLQRALHDESPWVSLRAAYGLRELGAMAELQQLAVDDGPLGQLAREVLSS